MQARVKELREEQAPLVGLAFSADGERLGVVDETGAVLADGAIFALLTAYLLEQGSPDAPVRLMRGRTATRLIDRLATLPAYVEQIIPPDYPDGLPPYMRQDGYRRLAGDPAALVGTNVYIDDGDFSELPAALLIAGDAHGGIILDPRLGMDGLRAALLFLQCCAMRQGAVQALWQALQQRLEPSHTERHTLYIPDQARLALINRAIERYGAVGASRLASAEYQLGGCTVHFAGGVPDRYIEWALTDPQGEMAYLSVTQAWPQPAILIEAEARHAEMAHRLTLTIAEQIESLLGEEFQRAGNPWDLVEMLAGMTSPLAAAQALPGTLNCRLAGEVYSRLQELAHPGREAPALLRFVTDQLRELQPENARALAACHLGQTTKEGKTPPVPRVVWESEGEL